MTKELPYIFAFYNEELTKMISEKYGFSLMESFRAFIFSETYKMLINPELEMWDFSPIGIFDMWEAERVTGNPRNSVYIRQD